MFQTKRTKRGRINFFFLGGGGLVGCSVPQILYSRGQFTPHSQQHITRTLRGRTQWVVLCAAPCPNLDPLSSVCQQLLMICVTGSVVVFRTKRTRQRRNQWVGPTSERDLNPQVPRGRAAAGSHNTSAFYQAQNSCQTHKNLHNARQRRESTLDCAKSLQGEAPCGSGVYGKVDEMSPAPSPAPLPRPPIPAPRWTA